MREVQAVRMPRKKARGFTLIEMMTVVGIILVLSMIAIYTVKYASYRNSQALSNALFAQIGSAFDQYRADWRYYPQQPQEAGGPKPLTISFLKKLVRPGFENRAKEEDQAPGWYLPGCDKWTRSVDPKNSSTTDCVVDGFGSILYYQTYSPSYPIIVNKDSFDLWSAGPDYYFGKVGTNTAWMADPKASYLDSSGSTTVNKNIICDDITNWKRTN